MSSCATDPTRPLVIGILGGIASGKSVVTDLLAQRGATVLIADKIAHEVLARSEVIGEMTKAFGRSVLVDSASLQVDRRKLAELVFGNTEEHSLNRKQLEAIVQTRVRTELLRAIREWRATITTRKESEQAGELPLRDFLVLDIPLLIERDWEKECDEILMVDTPLERRRQFAAKRGWSPMQLESREAAQMPVEEKRQHATHILQNDGTIEDLKVELDLWVSQICGRASSKSQ